jgi:multiple sugar transport system permease protein
VGGAVDPDDPVDPLHAEPEWGLINSLIFGSPARTGPTGSTIRTRLAHRDRRPHLEVAAVLDAHPDRRPACDSGRALRGRVGRRRTGWQKFRFITWPSMRTLYLTCTILSMIFTLGDFNSVYLLTGGGRLT